MLIIPLSIPLTLKEHGVPEKSNSTVYLCSSFLHKPSDFDPDPPNDLSPTEISGT